MTSDKERRKTFINEEIKSVKNTITEKEKNKVVPEKETFDAMEKSVTADAAMTKVFTKKAVTPRRNCDKKNKEIEVPEQTLLGIEAKKSKL